MLDTEQHMIVLQDVWGMPKEAEANAGQQPVKDTVSTMVGMAQQAAYQAFLIERQKRNTHHPRGETPFHACIVISLAQAGRAACCL